MTRLHVDHITSNIIPILSSNGKGHYTTFRNHYLFSFHEPFEPIKSRMSLLKPQLANHFLRDYILMTPWINDKLGSLASRGAYSLKLSARMFNVLEYRMTLDLHPLLRHHLRLPRYFFLWKFSIFFCHYELFGLQATL